MCQCRSFRFNIFFLVHSVCGKPKMNIIKWWNGKNVKESEYAMLWNEYGHEPNSRNKRRERKRVPETVRKWWRNRIINKRKSFKWFIISWCVDMRSILFWMYWDGMQCVCHGIVKRERKSSLSHLIFHSQWWLIYKCLLAVATFLKIVHCSSNEAKMITIFEEKWNTTDE